MLLCEVTMPECDTCNNYEWDEDTQEYFCAADMDEDECRRENITADARTGSRMMNMRWCGIRHFRK